MGHFIDSFGNSITGESPAIVRAFAVANALRLKYPTQPMVSWVGHHTPEYDNSIEFWQPYGFLPDGAAYVLPWARGAFGYFAGVANVEAPDIRSIDPGLWYHGLLEKAVGFSPDDYTKGAFMLAHEQTSTEMLWGDQVDQFQTRIRSAIQTNSLLVEPGAVRRRMAKIARSKYDLLRKTT